MPRRASIPRKSKYEHIPANRTTARFHAKLMTDGKKNLAERILCHLDGSYRLERLKFHRGRALAPGERSAGLYCLATGCGRPLRVSLFHDAAQMMCDWENRFLYECFVQTQS